MCMSSWGQRPFPVAFPVFFGPVHPLVPLARFSTLSQNRAQPLAHSAQPARMRVYLGKHVLLLSGHALKIMVCLAGLGPGCPLQSVRTTVWPLYGNRESLPVRLVEFAVV